MNKHHLFNTQKLNSKKDKKSQKYFIIGTLATLLAACGQKAQTPDEKLYDKLIDLATNANIVVSDGNATVELKDAGGTVVIASGDNVVTGGKGADTVTTGSGDDLVDTGAGADTIITGDGVDIVRAGAGADNVNTGDGKDVIVVIGINENGNSYTQAAITNAGANIDLSSIINLSDINNFGVAGAVSDVVSGDVIDGGGDGATLIVYGEVDMTGVDLSNITVIEIHSKLILTVAQIKSLVASGKFEEIIGDDTSTIVIENDANDPDATIDLTGFDIKNVKKLELDDNVEVKIDQDNIDGLQEIEGKSGAQITVEKEAGASEQDVNLTDLKFSGIDKLELGDDVKATLGKDNLDGLKEIGSTNPSDKIEIKLEAKDGEEELDLTDIKLENVEKLELGDDVKVTLNQENIDGLKEVAAETAGGEVEIKLEKTEGESEVDLTGLDIKDVDKLEVDGGIDLKVDKSSLDGLGEIGKADASDDDFSLKIEQDSESEGEVDLSKLEISGVDKLEVSEEVVVVIEQELIDELDEVTGDGAVQSETEGETLDLGEDSNITVATDNGGGSVTYTNEISMDENDTGVNYGTLNGVDMSVASFALSGDDAALFSVNSAGELSFNSAPDFESPTDNGADNQYNVTLDVTEGPTSSVHNIVINLTNANEAPVFSSAALQQAVVEENSTTLALAPITATDPDAGDAIVYSLSGADAAFFTINSSTSAVNFVGGQNFEDAQDAGANNVYNVAVNATDSSGASTARNIEVTVTDVNEAPEFDGTLATTASVVENGVDVGVFAAADVDNDDLSYELVGNDAALFTVNVSTGQVDFLVAPDYETDPHTYNIIVKASDGTLTAEHAVEISIDNVAETPDAYVPAYSPKPGGAQELTDSGEYQTRSTALSNGNSVVTFSSWHDVDQQDHIFAQLLDSNGDKIDGAIQVSGDDNPDNNFLTSEVAALTDGEFAVVWSKSDNGLVTYHAKLFEDDGAPNGGEIAVLSTEHDGSRNPYVEMTADGNLIFVMSEKITDVNNNEISSIVAKTYNVTTGTLGAEFNLPNHTYTDGSQSHEFVEDLFVTDTGDVVIIFGSDNKANSQVLSVSNGVISTVGDRFVISEGVENNGQWIKAAQLADGNFAVAWLLQVDGFENQILYRVFAADQTPISDVMNVDTADDAFILGPQITAVNGGGFAIVMVTEKIDQGGKLLQIQEYLADGTPAGNSVILNSDYNGEDATLFPTSLSVLNGDQLLVSWFGRPEDGSSHEGRYQVIDFHTDSSYVYQMEANGIEPFPTDAMATAPDDETLEMILSDVPLGIEFFNPNNGSSSPVGVYVVDGNGTTQTVTIAGGDITDLHIFNPAGDANFTIAISVVATDGNGGTAARDFDLNFGVIDYGSAPVIAMDEVQNAVENNVFVAEINFTDVDSADTHTFDITGEDKDLFEVVNGDLVFKNAQDADSLDDHSFRFTLKVTDNKGNSDQQEIEVRLADMEEAPVIDDSNLNFSIEEGSTGDIATIEIDGDEGGVRFKLGGTDAGLFSIDRYDGELKFAVRPDFDNKLDSDADNIYDLDVIAYSENTGLSSSEAVTVTVTENASETVVTAPVLSVPHFELVDGRYVEDANYGTDQGYVANNPLVYEHGGKLTTLSTGRVVIVWTEEDTADGSQTEPDTVYFKVLADDGLTEIIGRTVLLTPADSDHQLAPAVTADASGGFHVSFYKGDEDDSEIMVSHVSASGDVYTPGALLALTNVPSENVSGTRELETNLNVLSTGDYLVSYQTNHADLFVNIVDSSAGTIENTIALPDALDTATVPEAAQESLPSVAVLDDDSGFVVTWFRKYDNGENNRTEQIAVQRYDNDGVAQTGVNELGNTDNENKNASVTALSGSNYIVTWATRAEDAEDVVVAQLFNSSGEVGDSFVVSDTNDYSSDPEVIQLLGVDGGFLIVWNDSGEMRGQQFEDDGTKIGGNFTIARQPQDDGVSQIEITALSDGGFVVTWGDKRLSDNVNNTNDGEDGDIGYQVYKFETSPTLFHHDWQHLPNSVAIEVDDASVDYYEMAILGAPDDLDFDVRNDNNHDGHAHEDHRTGDTWIFDASDMENLSFRVNNNFEGPVTLTYVVTAIGQDGSSVSSSSIVLNYDIQNINNEPHYHDDFGSNNLSIFEGERVLMKDGETIIREGYDHDGDDFEISIDQDIKDGHLFAVGADGSIFFKSAPDSESSQAENQDEAEIYKFTLVITDEHGAENRTEYEVEVKDRDDDALVGETISAPALASNDGELIDMNLSLTSASTGTVDDIVIFNTEGFVFSAGESYGDGSWKVAASDIPTLAVQSHNNVDGVHSFVFEVRTVANSGADGATRTTQTIDITFTDVNNGPVFAPGNTDFNVTVSDLDIGNIIATDSDPGDVLTYSLTGVDAANFDYDSATGKISFKSGFEPIITDEGETLEFTITATDGAGSTDATIDITVTVDPLPADLASTYFLNPNELSTIRKEQLTFDEGNEQQQRDFDLSIINQQGGVLTWRQGNDVYIQEYAGLGNGGIQGSPTLLIEDKPEPTAAITAGGNLVLAWHEYDGDHDGIYAAFGTFGGGGPELGDRVRVNTDIEGNSRNVELEILQSNEGAAFIWSQGDGQNNDIFGRIVIGDATDPNSATGDVFQVNSHEAGNQTDYKVTALADDSIVVTWTSYGGQDDSGAGVYMQQFKINEAGSTVALLNGGVDLQINDRTLGDQDRADVTALANGNFVVTWHDTANWGDVKAKLFSGDGTGTDLTFDATGGLESTLLASDEPNYIGQNNPTVFGLANGEFVLVWRQNRYDDETDTSYEGIVGQRFLASGVKVSEQFVVDQFVRDDDVDQWYGDIKVTDAPTAVGTLFFNITWQFNSREDGQDEVSNIYTKAYGQGQLIKMEADQTIELPVQTDMPDDYDAVVTITGLEANMSVYETHDNDAPATLLSAVNDVYTLTKAQYQNIELVSAPSFSSSSVAVVDISLTAPNGETASTQLQFNLLVGEHSVVDSNREFTDQANQIDFVVGTDFVDTFIINGNSADFTFYAYGTDLGVVNSAENSLDLLHGIENVEFTNATFTLEQLNILGESGQTLDPEDKLAALNLFDYDPLSF